MPALLSTSLIAMVGIVCATVAVCTGHIGPGDWLATVGIFGGAAGAHAVTLGRTSSTSASGGAGGGT